MIIMTAVKVKFKKGDWVKDTNYGYVGRIFAVHPNWKKAGNDNVWYSYQVKKPSKGRYQPWYDILVVDGGAAMIAEQNLKPHAPVPGSKIKNAWWSKHF